MKSSIEQLASSLDGLRDNYDALLGLLARVGSGEIHPCQLVVDLQARTWRVRDREEAEARVMETLQATKTVHSLVAAVEAANSGSNGHGGSTPRAVRMEDLRDGEDSGGGAP